MPALELLTNGMDQLLRRDFPEKSLPRNALVVGLQPLQPQVAAAGAIALAQINRLPRAKAQFALLHNQQEGWPVQGGFMWASLLPSAWR